jgi:hypothetical protein
MRESPWRLDDAARPRILRCTLAPPAKGTLAGKPPQIPSVKKDDKVVPESRPTSALGRSTSNGNGGTTTGVLATTTESAPGMQPPAPIDTALGESVSSAPAPEELVSKPIIVDQDDTLQTEPGSQTSAEGSTQPVDEGMTAIDPNTPDPTSLLARHSSTLSRRPSSQPTPRHIPAPTPQRRGQNFHVRPDLVPVTRFHTKDLEEHWYKLVAFVLDGTGSLEERMKWLDPTFEAGSDTDNDLSGKVNEYIPKHPTSFPSAPDPELSEEEIKKYYFKITNPDAEPIPDPAELRDKSHPFMFIQSSELDNELFDRLWARGEPIVVDKVGERFKKVWTPDTFIERFGVEQCCKLPFPHVAGKEKADELVVIDCETEAIKQTSVGQFFETFKDPAQRATKGVWKLKVSSEFLIIFDNTS